MHACSVIFYEFQVNGSWKHFRLQLTVKANIFMQSVLGISNCQICMISVMSHLSFCVLYSPKGGNFYRLAPNRRPTFRELFLSFYPTLKGFCCAIVLCNYVWVYFNELYCLSKSCEWQLRLWKKLSILTKQWFR